MKPKILIMIMYFFPYKEFHEVNGNKCTKIKT